MTKLRNFCNTK